MNKLNNANYDTSFNDITITYIDINNTLDFFKYDLEKKLYYNILTIIF